jgi:hypothetical protein
VGSAGEVDVGVAPQQVQEPGSPLQERPEGRGWRRVDRDDVLEPRRERRIRGEGAPVAEGDATGPEDRPDVLGNGRRREPRRDDRHAAAPEARRGGRPFDELATAQRVARDDEDGAAGGGEGRHRGDPRVSAPVDGLAALVGPRRGAVQLRPAIDRRLELGVDPPPPLLVVGPGELPRRRGAGRVEAPEDHPRLDRAVPLVDLESDRDVELLLGRRGGAELAVDSEGDPEGPPGSAREREAGVALAAAHRPDVG